MDKNQIQNAFSSASRISENLTNNLKQNTNQITNNIIDTATKLGQTLGLESSSSLHQKIDKKKKVANRHHERTSAMTDDGTLDCSCDLQSICLAINEIKQDPGFDSITLDNLIIDGCTSNNNNNANNTANAIHNRKVGAIHEMLVSTMLLGGDNGSGASNNQKRSSLPTTKAFRTARPRHWKQINFVDCINNKATYVEYMDKRKKFYAQLKKHYNQSTHHVGPVMDLPIDFCIKMEFNSKMEIFNCVQMFRLIVEDDNIDDQMEFSNVGALELKKYDTLSDALAASFDRTTLKWIGHNVDLNIFYLDNNDGESSRSLFLQNNKHQQQPGGGEQQEEEQERLASQRIKHMATKEGLKECARKLEKLAYQSSNTSILSSVTSQQTTITIQEEEESDNNAEEEE